MLYFCILSLLLLVSCIIVSLMRASFQKLKYLPSGSDDENDFGFSFNKDVSLSLCLSSGINVGLSQAFVFLGVFVSIGNKHLSLCGSISLCLVSLVLVFLEHLGVSCSFFLYVLGDDSIRRDNILVIVFVKMGICMIGESCLRYDTS
jgi:hypothetical protein